MSLKTGIQAAAKAMKIASGITREQTRQTPAEGMGQLLDQWKTAAETQKQQRIDETTREQEATLRQNLAESTKALEQQRNQSDAEAARSLDNSALYAEARGDRGGIGQAQYQAIQAAALQNRARFGEAQTQLAADTARQIAELRAKGEFEKADALLQVGQDYLTQLIKLRQWDADWQESQEKQRTALEQWQKNYELSRARVTGELEGEPTFTAKKTAQDQFTAYAKQQLSRQDREQEQQADAAALLLKAGVVPDEQQLKALGLTSQQAKDYIQSLILYGKLG